MESTFLWQANLKSAMMNVANLRTIFVSQLTSTFYVPCKVGPLSSIYLASKVQALISVMLATAIVYPRCFAVLPGVAIIGGTGGTRPPQHFGWGDANVNVPPPLIAHLVILLTFV